MPGTAHVIGVDDVDVDAATELGIVVTHALTESVLYPPRGEVSEYLDIAEVTPRWQSRFGTKSVRSVSSESAS